MFNILCKTHSTKPFHVVQRVKLFKYYFLKLKHLHNVIYVPLDDHTKKHININ